MNSASSGAARSASPGVVVLLIGGSPRIMDGVLTAVVPQVAR